MPALDVRLAKHLLARTCVRPADETPDQWRNAAGVSHDPRTGFGVIDAGAFVKAALGKPSVTPFQLEPDSARRDDELGMERVKVEADVPDGGQRGITKEFTVKGGMPLEEVEVFLEVRHRRRGELSATLESPSGTKRALFTSHIADKGEDVIWIFTTHAFWGEEPRGVWRLTVTDSVTGEAGRWESFAWRMRMGELRDTRRE